MDTKIFLKHSYFTESPNLLLENDDFKATAFRYPSGIESIKIRNAKGYVELLPYMGQIIWDAAFNGIDLRLKNIFDQPKPATCIIDTYGCFAFHSGLLANGCPAPDDTHPMHGEFSCAPMDEAWLEMTNDAIALISQYEYMQGFGYHYIARPRVALEKNATRFEIRMEVTNLTCIEMPLQYMCHMNYAYVDHGRISSNLPGTAFKLRESIPSHVHPTEKWLAYNEVLKKMQQEGRSLEILDQPDMYDPEIVFMADHIDQYAQDVTVEIDSPKGYGFRTNFSTKDFTNATRWIMKNEDLQVAAFVLPATCRPEGFLAAKKAGTLLHLKTNETKTFTVTTGLK